MIGESEVVKRGGVSCLGVFSFYFTLLLHQFSGVGNCPIGVTEV